ncbi:hypothetical protein [Pseudomonas sp. MWU12-2345]|uniref:DUF7683 domain-containing protein n=1 Tax=Pseudomonas sp. MWU12-2345 TaxID=2928689 RepID=UPI0032C4811C
MLRTTHTEAGIGSDRLVDNLRYVIEAFDKETELMAFEIELPDDCEEQLSAVMAWSAPQRGDEGYDLSPSQLDAIEALAGRKFYDQRYIFQLTCNAF